jgi:hypothetical protein
MSASAKLRCPFVWVALAAALIVLSLCVLSIRGILFYGGVPRDIGWSSQPRGDYWVVAEVDGLGPAGGKLRGGDRIVSVNGSRGAARFGPPATLTTSDSYEIEVSRKGTPERLVLPVWPIPDYAWQDISYVFLALINLGVAIWIGWARPDMVTARVAFFLLLCAARILASSSLHAFTPPLGQTSFTLTLLFASKDWQPLSWAVAFDFGLRFPEPVQQPRILRIIRVLFYLAAALLLAAGILPAVANVLGLPTRSALLPHWFSLAQFDLRRPAINNTMAATALLSFPLLLARNYWKLPDPLARRRLRWVALGIGLSVLPIALGISAQLVLPVFGVARSAERVQNFVDTFGSFFQALGPITLTYAIIKHKILGIRVAIRIGIQYLLAKNVLRLILYLPFIAIAIDLALHPNEQLREFLLHKSWWFYAFLIISASLSLRYHKRMTAWVDRKFFRSAYEEEVILSELIDNMHACEKADEVARIVAEELRRTLQPSSISVLCRKEAPGRFTVGYPHDSPIALEFRGILNERMQSALESHRSARSFPELAATVEGSGSTSSESMRNTLLTPVNSATGQLLGVLLLGDKKSEEPYSARDCKLLQAVATQMGLVLEMLALRERVREEGRVRVEVLGRLDEREIQLVMECPECGRCYTKPATVCSADGANLGLTLPIERVIDGKYRLERRIGAGGMGAVYEATDLRLDRTVAVKVMTGRLFGNHAALRRFEREARAVARLQHNNIVAIHDFGSLRGDGAYLVMQRIDGKSWRMELKRSGRIRPARAAVWFDQLCDAMSCAHSNGVIHRDLKPENLLISNTPDGMDKITVLDFGLAKLHTFHNPQLDLTTGTHVVGTYGYMSPEQRAGEPADARTDVYSIAVITVETLSKQRPPASGASRRWLRASLQWANPTPVCSELMNLLDRCMADLPSTRVESTEALQRELIPLLKECPPLLATKAQSADGGDAVTLPQV